MRRAFELGERLKRPFTIFAGKPLIFYIFVTT